MQSVELKTVETKSSNALSELIPEGFFDDPKEDARVTLYNKHSCILVSD